MFGSLQDFDPIATSMTATTRYTQAETVSGPWVLAGSAAPVARPGTAQMATTRAEPKAKHQH